MLYTLQNLTKVHADRTVLDIGSLEFQRGDVCGLMGPNGAGKTTLLNILGFLEPPSSGTICYNGQPVQMTESSLQELRKNVILVDQQPILFTTSVYRNIEFGLKVRNIPTAKRRAIIEDALRLVDMDRFAYAPAWRLSGGETQRAALARAMAVMPDVLLCDEPTASVDTENQAAIINILRQINAEKGITVLFATHDRFQAASLAHRLLYLDHGRLSAIPVENVFAAVWHRENGNDGLCDIQGLLKLGLALPAANSNLCKLRLRIHPQQIRLVSSSEPSNDNDGGKPNQRVSGRVVLIAEEQDSIRITVNAGAWITLLTPKEEYVKAPVNVGSQVTIAIPSDAIEVLSRDEG